MTTGHPVTFTYLLTSDPFLKNMLTKKKQITELMLEDLFVTALVHTVNEIAALYHKVFDNTMNWSSLVVKRLLRLFAHSELTYTTTTSNQ